jgi:hypothetical protein
LVAILRIVNDARPQESEWVPADEDGTPWGYPLLTAHDFIYGDAGATQGIGQMIAPDGRTFEFHFYSGNDIKIELSEQAFAALGQFPKYLRSVGLGKLRKDMSTPLMAPSDQIWVQSAQDSATLVMRPPGSEPAFFRIGYLGLGALRMARGTHLGVLFLIGTNVLPGPTMRAESRAGMAGKAWGGLVSCTAAGPGGAPDGPDSTYRGTARAHHARLTPELVLEGIEAARAALRRSQEGSQPLSN